jgi:23S rRNA (cytidine2498-2'-O)-methyltransferase
MPTRPTAPLETPEFLFVTCQQGAETALKREMARLRPDFRSAFARPGLLTFKMPPDSARQPDFDPASIFARAWGFSLGNVKAGTVEERATKAWQLSQDLRTAGVVFDRLHVWQRDGLDAARREESPMPSEASHAARSAILQAASQGGLEPSARESVMAEVGDWVLDVVIVEDDSWLVGYHKQSRAHLPWPGGLSDKALPEHAVSRAYLKLDQALIWSRLPVVPGDLACELGSSPGGAAQALLDRGLSVLGIDPAAMHEDVLANPNFEHIQRRSPAVPRKMYRKCRWLFADMNVAPEYTLEAVEEIVTRSDNRIRGMVLTLKLTDWNLAEELPAQLARIRKWGFEPVFARQLQHHRQEIAVAAHHPALKRTGPPPGRRKSQGRGGAKSRLD